MYPWVAFCDTGRWGCRAGWGLQSWPTCQGNMVWLLDVHCNAAQGQQYQDRLALTDWVDWAHGGLDQTNLCLPANSAPRLLSSRLPP